jgi:hypothetical protein
MPQMIAKLEQARQFREYLEQQALKGHKWVVYDTDNQITTTHSLHCFHEEWEALDYAREYQQIWNWHEAVPLADLLYNLKELEQASKMTLENKDNIILKHNNMNLNNLENLKDELKELRFDKKLSEEMEKNMQKNLPEFQLRQHLPADKGQVDFLLHFKQSGQSDFYYFNKYDVSLNTAKPLAEGQKYLVISPGEQGKPIFRKFENPNEAITYFKEQKGNAELAAGKDPGNKTTLATMEKDKVNFVTKDFQKTFYAPAKSQTIYVEKGNGFTAEQAANLIQGRAVHRDNLLNLGGEPYKAWIALDFDKPKDRHQNYLTRQFHDPSYGFDLKKTLEKFQIKELDDPKAKGKLEESLKNGNRPLITVVKDGQEIKLRIEAVPRYSQINLYAENGKPEKREQFLKEPVLSANFSKDKTKEKELSESTEMKL